MTREEEEIDSLRRENQRLTDELTKIARFGTDSAIEIEDLKQKLSVASKWIDELLGAEPT